jgi:hypothetical protein
MKGDFSRLTFDPARQYTRVLMQQGRVQLDADWNEQADILLHYLRTLAADLIGPFGAPPEADGTAGLGFKLISRRKADGKLGLFLLPGRYYVDGIAARNTQEWPVPDLDRGARFLIYLDVWERHVTYLQEELLREVALLGPDTATRSKVVWRVGFAREIPRPVLDLEPNLKINDLTCRSVRRHWSRWVEEWQPPQRGRLKARARPGMPDDTDPCLASPDARYRGENQLYRVEIHAGGAAGPNGTAAFKWSADNGSMVFPVRDMDTDTASHQTTAILEHLGRGEGAGLVQDDWVEIVDGTEDLRQGTDPLLQVASVDADRRRVVLKGEPPSGLGQPLMLRRWDHRRGIARKKLKSTGVYPITEDEWLDLEDGVQILFDKAPEGTANVYRSGDCWLIPARVATGDVEWPGPPEAPESRPPRGVEHHYAPLGLLAVDANEKVDFQDCRTTFGATSWALTTGVANWQLVRDPSGAITPPRPADIVVRPDNAWDLIPGAHWISSTPQAADLPAGKYTFELRFDLCSCFHRPHIWLYLLADDSAEISLNGTSIRVQEGFKKPPFHFELTGLNPADQPWVKDDEENVLTVVVNNKQKSSMALLLYGAVDGDCHCR